ncbi:RNA polymerase sigma factor [Catalinimonas alkaloidigena]|nr:sigma-70 family RNA polymerase sigma factor [Catalinimonas alkaloidigena]
MKAHPYPQPDDDLELWNDFRAGDETAFATLYRSYFRLLFSYGTKLCAEPEFVKDQIQDLFFSLWQTRQRIGETGSVKFYLMKSLRRKIFRAVQQRKERLVSDDQQLVFGVEFSHERTLILEQSQRERQTRLIEALNQLPERQREVLYLRFFSNLSYAEIADLLSINVQSVRNHIHRSVTALRVSLPYFIESCLVMLSVRLLF